MRRISSLLFFLLLLFGCNRHMQSMKPNSGFTRDSTRQASGIDFIAMGNEPFWSVDIDLEKQMCFHSLNGDSLVTGLPEADAMKNDSGIVYRGQSGDRKLLVKIFDKPCADNMSGETFTHSVEVTVNQKTHLGCGKYLADERLRGHWRLRVLNGIPVSKENWGRENPYLDFDLASNRISGSGGCNRIGGKCDWIGDRMIPSITMMTRMACPIPSVESDFMNCFDDGALNYKLEGNSLSFSKNGKTIMVFER